jgi:hypothetical protein
MPSNFVALNFKITSFKRPENKILFIIIKKKKLIYLKLIKRCYSDVLTIKIYQFCTDIY